ncbi:hypothetical protein [Streptomyces sp. BBFR102]|uniref:hypothetical protein n=1 Tax=Streptomyces sp. BBFR102 TaxID=3448171 RepID=UPI003F539E2E
MAGTTIRTEIHIRCKGCPEAFKVTDEGVIKVYDAEYGEMDWLTGATLADYVADPTCSNCFGIFNFETGRVTR